MREERENQRGERLDPRPGEVWRLTSAWLSDDDPDPWYYVVLGVSPDDETCFDVVVLHGSWSGRVLARVDIPAPRVVWERVA